MRLSFIIFILLSGSVLPRYWHKFFEQNYQACFNYSMLFLSSSNSKDVKGGLSLDTRQGILNGGTLTQSVVPGKIDESLLLDYIESGDMPPDNPLSEDVVNNFRQWIKMGMPDPRYKLRIEQ